MTNQVLIVVDPNDYRVTDRLMWAGDAKTQSLLAAKVSPKIVVPSDISQRIFPGHIYDPNTQTFSIPTPVISRERLLEWVETQRYKYTMITNVTIDGVSIPVQTRDLTDYTNLEALKTAAENGQGCTFHDADNIDHMFTAAQMVELYGKVMAARMVIAGKAIAVRAAVNAGTFTTREQINDPANWT